MPIAIPRPYPLSLHLYFRQVCWPSPLGSACKFNRTHPHSNHSLTRSSQRRRRRKNGKKIRKYHAFLPPRDSRERSYTCPVSLLDGQLNKRTKACSRNFSRRKDSLRPRSLTKPLLLRPPVAHVEAMLQKLAFLGREMMMTFPDCAFSRHFAARGISGIDAQGRRARLFTAFGTAAINVLHPTVSDRVMDRHPFVRVWMQHA